MSSLRKRFHRVLPIAGVSLVLACGESSPSDGAGGPAAGGGDASTGVGGAATSSTGAGGAAGDWDLLLEGSWSLEPGSEAYVCVVATVPEEVYVGAFRPIAPLGTHHTVLTVTDVGEDGVFPCGAGTNGENMIYGSGVGTEAAYLPPGVAVKLAAGDKVLLNLHLFNASSSTLEGVSGIEIQRVEPDQVEHEAESVLAGTVMLDIPPQSTVTETGHCVVPNDVTLFGVAPHMHQFGNHLKVTAITDAGDTVLHDDAYSFDEQRYYPVEPMLDLQAGDQLRVDCTYTNTTPQTVTFGDSSNAEMCFAGLYVYPAGAFGIFCGD